MALSTLCFLRSHTNALSADTPNRPCHSKPRYVMNTKILLLTSGTPHRGRATPHGKTHFCHRTVCHSLDATIRHQVEEPRSN